MKIRRFPGWMGWMPGAALVVAAMVSSPAAAQTLTTLVNFDGTNGASPEFGSLVADANGNLFGTTFMGGTSNLGTVFKVEKLAGGGYATTPTVLFNFDGTHGATPYSGVIIDSAGNLFGTATFGGTSNYGTVYKLEKTSTGYASAPVVLFNFDIVHGVYPAAGLIADAAGNLYGTTVGGGTSGLGEVFRMDKTSTGYADPTILASFDSVHGFETFSGLIADSNGNLFGTTIYGGASNQGTLYEIEKTSAGYSSTPTVLFSFDSSTTGTLTFGGLTADASGNLFGMSSNGGALGYGVAFKLAKTTSGYATTPTILINFDPNTGGSYPYSGLLIDANGNLFGTTLESGSGRGTVFKLAKTSTGYAATPMVLIDFDGTNGASPSAGLIADRNGNLFSTTAQGGTFGAGTVFQVSGSGFAAPSSFAGTPGTANCSGVSLSSLSRAYGGLAAAAKALGYASAADLQAAITAYCGK